MSSKIQIRRDTAANWTAANPTLLRGEMGFEYDTNKIKIGDGSTPWNSLNYMLITQSIANGDTEHAPSADAIYDALVSEQSSRQAAINALQSDLNTEVTAREAADRSFGFTYEVHVAKNGSNSGSTGKPHQPFLTIAAAVSYVESTFVSGESVAIYIHPGSYSEAVTITRPRTHLVGVQSTSAIITEIGSITLAPTAVVGGVYNSSFSIQNALLGAVAGASAALTVAGTAECSLHLRNVYLYADDSGQKCLAVTNTSATKSRFYFNDVLANNTLCSATALDLSNCVVQMKNTTVYSGAGTCLAMSSSASGIAAFCLLETSGVLAVDVGATSFSLGMSTITASGSNASGVSVANGGTYTTVQNFYNVASGTGYAITGTAGGVVTHAINTFAYGSNNKHKNVLVLLAHSTTMTSAS
jgi:hypothetical protein